MVILNISNGKYTGHITLPKYGSLKCCEKNYILKTQAKLTMLKNIPGHSKTLQALGCWQVSCSERYVYFLNAKKDQKYHIRYS